MLCLVLAGFGLTPARADTNPITIENAKAGNPSSQWDVSGAGDPSIQGFATQISVNKGENVRFKIKTNATDTVSIINNDKAWAFHPFPQRTFVLEAKWRQ